MKRREKDRVPQAFVRAGITHRKRHFLQSPPGGSLSLHGFCLLHPKEGAVVTWLEKKQKATLLVSLPLGGACTPSASEGRSSGVKVSSDSETDEVSLLRVRECGFNKKAGSWETALSTVRLFVVAAPMTTVPRCALQKQRRREQRDAPRRTPLPSLLPAFFRPRKTTFETRFRGDGRTRVFARARM